MTDEQKIRAVKELIATVESEINTLSVRLSIAQKSIDEAKDRLKEHERDEQPETAT